MMRPLIRLPRLTLAICLTPLLLWRPFPFPLLAFTPHVPLVAAGAQELHPHSLARSARRMPAVLAVEPAPAPLPRSKSAGCLWPGWRRHFLAIALRRGLVRGAQPVQSITVSVP